jgi:hypothetical protein
MSDITGEYWVIDGSVDFADGDVGDKNHEMIAVDHVAGNYVDAVDNLADQYELPSNANHYGEPDIEGIAETLRNIHERLTMGPDDGTEPDPNTLMKDKQAWQYIQQQLGCDDDALAILLGGGDARTYAMEKSGWIAIRSNNVELYGYDASRQAEIAEAIEEILWEEGHEQEVNPEEVELSIYDHKSGKSWYVTLADLKQPQITARPQQLAMTTYNKSMHHLMNPKDSEENKYSNPAKSQPNKWNAAAQKTRIIGPGQQLWRGTSEGFFAGFREWLHLLESRE